MSGKQISTVLFVCGVTALFAADLVEAPGKTPDAQEIAATDKAEAELRTRIANVDTRKRKETWRTGGAVLNREDDGHFYATVSVEGRDYRFLVDTGATIVALTGPDAQAMGFEWSDSDLKPIGRGASGDVRGVPVRIDRLEIAGIEARSVDAAIIPEGLDTSLLGQSVLSQFPDVAIHGDEMSLGS